MFLRNSNKDIPPTNSGETILEQGETSRISGISDEPVNTLPMPKIGTEPPFFRLDPMSSRRHAYTRAILKGREKFIYFLLVGAWLSTVIFFWIWWFRPDHIVTPAGMMINSLVLLWTILFPGYCFFFAARMHEPNPAQPLPAGRVAMVVTKVPSEPWPMLKKTLT